MYAGCVHWPFAMDPKIGLAAGLLVVLPLVWFMWRRIISPRESIRYWLVAAGFGIQGAIGWVMVASGLEDRPAVSEMRLTIHLLAALTLLGIVLWMAMDRVQAGAGTRVRSPRRSLRFMTWAVFAAVIVQIAWGGLVAGLKAGFLSNTWPLMFGYLLPPGMMTTGDTWFLSLFEPLASHWIHRWFAFVVLIMTVALLIMIRKDSDRDERLVPWAYWLVGVTAGQIALGVSVILLGVPKYFALAHQAVGIAVFCLALVITHHVESAARSKVDSIDVSVSA